jgi:hypothetical protein
MTMRRGVSSAVIFAGVAVGLAGPVGADPGIFEGYYTYAGGGVTRPWIATSCGTGCSHVEAPQIPGQEGFSGDAQLAYGGWALTRHDVPDAVPCGAGSRAPGNITYRWNPGTMSGLAVPGHRSRRVAIP